MKSMSRRPAGEWKNVSPLGGGAWPNAAERPPVSEFELPKLKMAGKLQLLLKPNVVVGRSSPIISNVKALNSIEFEQMKLSLGLVL